MDERNMIIGMVLVLLVIGAYFVFAQDILLECTSDADCGKCQVCDDGFCFQKTCYNCTAYCTVQCSEISDPNCYENCLSGCPTCPECCNCNIEEGYYGTCNNSCTADSDCPSGCSCVNNACTKSVTPPPSRPESCKWYDLNATVEVDCDENVVTVVEEKSRDPIAGVKVKVFKNNLLNQSGTTDSNGEFMFTLVDGTAELHFSNIKKGSICYRAPSRFSVTLNTTEECKPECTTDADCASGYECKDNKCVAKPPPPPPPAPKPECTTDAECSSDKYCSNNKCVPVTGTCGYAANHTWVEYECCVDEDCPRDYECKEHKCKETTYNLTGKGGAVGSKGTVTAYTDGTVLADTQLKVTRPDGSYLFMTTDSDGRITVPFTQAGKYTVGIYVNGTLMKSLTVVSTTTAPVTPSRPTFFDVLAQNTPLLLVLLVVVVLAYWMFLRKPPKAARKRPGRLK